jgi:predicted alpha/beta-hydrolase family hydrolase
MRPMIFLAHGASAGVESMQPHVAGLARRGQDARAVALPKGKAERAVPVYGSALADAGPSEAVVGGHSYGGRVASLLAAETVVAGLILLSYPLHAPGRQPTWDERTAHWPRIACPVLLLSGESDPFADLGLLREAVKRLPNAELVTYPRLGHGVGPVLDDALDRVAAFVDGL